MTTTGKIVRRALRERACREIAPESRSGGSDRQGFAQPDRRLRVGVGFRLGAIAEREQIEAVALRPDRREAGAQEILRQRSSG